MYGELRGSCTFTHKKKSVQKISVKIHWSKRQDIITLFDKVSAVHTNFCVSMQVAGNRRDKKRSSQKMIKSDTWSKKKYHSLYLCVSASPLTILKLGSLRSVRAPVLDDGRGVSWNFICVIVPSAFGWIVFLLLFCKDGFGFK